MPIPKEVSEVTKFTRTKKNLTEYSCDMPTGVTAKFTTSMWLNGGTSVALSQIPFITENVGFIPVICAIAAVLSGGFLVIGSTIMSDDTFRDMEDEFQHMRKEIKPSEWEENPGKQFRIYSKSRRSAIVNMLLPRRIFKRVLMNETIWYEPTQDVYTVQKHYLTGFNWITETAEIEGRRRVFKKALDSF